jgi:hypothetical protein
MHIDHRLHQTATLIESSDGVLALGVNAWHLSNVAKSRNHTTRVTLLSKKSWSVDGVCRPDGESADLASIQFPSTDNGDEHE